MTETRKKPTFSLPEETAALGETAMRLDAEIPQAESRIRDLKARARKVKEALAIIKALGTSWDEHDPGKYTIASWLLTRDGEKCVAQELLPAGTPIYTDKEKWKEFLEEFAARNKKRSIWELRNDGHPYGAVSPWYPVVPLKDTLHAMCPACEKERPVIMTYEQTDDGPDGDTWTKQCFILCCQELSPIGKPKSSCSRF